MTLPTQAWYKGVAASVKRKAASAKEFWIGLTAFEFRKADFRFDKSSRGQQALAFFKSNGMPNDPDLIRPALASLNGRLKEIDEVYRRLF